MTLPIYKYHAVIAALFVAFLFSCKKNWLDAKPSKSLVVVSTLKDMQALLDYEGIMNQGHITLGEMGADNYFLTPTDYNNRIPTEKNSYIWAVDIFGGNTNSDWQNAYQKINYANIVLDALPKVDSTNEEWKIVKGQALFHRAFSFYNLAQVFAMPYSEATAGTDLGIALKLNADINQPAERVSILETYNKIIGDLQTAAGYLPVVQKAHGYYRPARAAAYALLARTYLLMGRYEEAFENADLCIQLNNQSNIQLLDYNSLTSTAQFPIPFPNSEILFHASCVNYGGVGRLAYTDSLLYKSYKTDDLRSRVFFNKNATGARFKGHYTRQNLLFGGIALDEVYLIRAECNARLGDKDAAMDDLNALMIKRWSNLVNYPIITATDANNALNIVLTERRKELLFRTIRWSDLRRLNRESQFAKSLIRVMGSNTYTLPPNDIKYTYPIPGNELLYNNIPQNPRQ